MSQDFNSTANQNIKEKFVGIHVYCNVNSLVEYCLKHGFEDSDSPVNYDELENFYTYPEYQGKHANFEGGTDEQRQAEIDRLKELIEDMEEDEERQAMEEEIDALEALEEEQAEVFEWWAVSDYLYRKLKEQGQVVCDAGSCYIWGRATTGQAILLDGVISQICSDMQILEGQANAWK